MGARVNTAQRWRQVLPPTRAEVVWNVPSKEAVSRHRPNPYGELKFIAVDGVWACTVSVAVEKEKSEVL